MGERESHSLTQARLVARHQRWSVAGRTCAKSLASHVSELSGTRQSSVGTCSIGLQSSVNQPVISQPASHQSTSQSSVSQPVIIQPASHHSASQSSVSQPVISQPASQPVISHQPPVRHRSAWAAPAAALAGPTVKGHQSFINQSSIIHQSVISHSSISHHSVISQSSVIH